LIHSGPGKKWLFFNAEFLETSAIAGNSCSRRAAGQGDPLFHLLFGAALLIETQSLLLSLALLKPFEFFHFSRRATVLHRGAATFTRTVQLSLPLVFHRHLRRLSGCIALPTPLARRLPSLSVR
jgi:hypothetical protein